MPAKHTSIKPVIRELVRTRLCFPDIRLLVDRATIIEIPITSKAENRQAYRLFLTDGEKTIQAVVRRRLHRTINNGEIREGSIVVLKDYHLARAKKITSDGEVIYLQIADFYSIGEDGRRYEESPVKLSLSGDEDVAHLPSHETPAVSPTSHIPKRKRDEASDEPDSNPRKRGRELERSPPDPKKNTDPASDALNDAKIHQNPSDLDTIEDTRNPSSEPTNSPPQSNPPPPPPDPPPSKAPPLPTNPKPIPRPLKISPLASLTGTNSSKNEIHDVLALIVHVDAHTYKPAHMPRKRDLRIMDTSTTKRVVLSVFTDPVAFEPRVGTIALMRNVMTHDWDGGNLKAWPWLCEGVEWFVPLSEDEGEDGGGGGVEGVERGLVDRLMELRNGMGGDDGVKTG